MWCNYLLINLSNVEVSENFGFLQLIRMALYVRGPSKVSASFKRAHVIDRSVTGSPMKVIRCICKTFYKAGIKNFVL